LKHIIMSVLAGLAVAAAPGGTACGEDTRGYTVTIGGVAVPIDPDETVNVRLEDGRSVPVTLRRNPLTRFSSPVLSFSYPSTLSASTKMVGGDTRQTIIVTAGGSMILLQEYASSSPLSPVEMLTALTEENVKLGDKLETAPAERTLKSGLKLTGVRGVIGRDADLYEILSYAGKGKGVLVAVKTFDEDKEAGSLLAGTFWNTLDVKP
jgi:hypothetical protein